MTIVSSACVSAVVASSLAAQSPRAANPERPTVATHAYTVAAGYAELEQGARAFGVDALREATAWDFNLKIGLARNLQLAMFGPGYVRTSDGVGIGDLGLAFKLSHPVSERTALAVVPSATFPTGNEQGGLGAGRTLASVTGVVSGDLPARFHFDVNAGPVAIGAGKPQWFTSVGLSRGGPIGFAGELFDVMAGAAGPRQRGMLLAVLVTAAEWAVIDAGGVAGLTRDTPDQMFVGLTTNWGRIFK